MKNIERIEPARLGARLRELRISKGLRIAEVARRMDSYTPIVIRIEKANRSEKHAKGYVHLLTLARYCDAIGVDILEALSAPVAERIVQEPDAEEVPGSLVGHALPSG